LEQYEALFGYSLGNTYSFMTVLKNSVPLILTGLSASVAFASGPVNLGQPGQLLMGAYLQLSAVFMSIFLQY
jgi:simple sugar transport system permease protein